MSYVVRPLSDRTWLRPEHRRQPSRFTAKWPETESLLLAEVQHLAGRNLVVEVDVREGDLRNDGRLRANARATSPAVVVAFDTRDHGPMLHRCDTLTVSYADQGPAWQHNVRAIAKTLEALRAVGRYGATETGQQYQGFKAIGGGTPLPGPTPMSRDAAAELLRGYATAGADLSTAHRRAIRATHPDTGGRREDFDRVQQAARALGLSR